MKNSKLTSLKPEKRHLTQAEIDDILGELHIYAGYGKCSYKDTRIVATTVTDETVEYESVEEDLDYVESILNGQKARLEADLKKQLIYPNLIPELKRIVVQKFGTSQIQPGEQVGALSAQSLGEPTMQMTLNTFHQTGGSKNVTLGMPRYDEILNATKNPKTPNMTVHFLENNTSISQIRKYYRHIQQIMASDLITKVNMFCSWNDPQDFDYLASTYFVQPYEPSWWLDMSLYMEDKSLPRDEDGMVLDYWCLRLKIDLQKLYFFDMTLKDIRDKLNRDIGHHICVISPLIEGVIEIFVNCRNVEVDQPKSILDNDELSDQFFIRQPNKNGVLNTFFITQQNAPYYFMKQLQHIIMTTHISGVSGITKIFPTRDPKKPGIWFLETNGTNLRSVLNLPFVDSAHVLCNHAVEIFYVLGVEACRAYLIMELTKLISFDTTYVDARHITLLADYMTNTGVLTAVSRHGISQHEVGPIAKASFEESLTRFVAAAEEAQIDHCNGVSCSVIMGKLAKIGTNSFDVMTPVEVQVEEEFFCDYEGIEFDEDCLII